MCGDRQNGGFQLPRGLWTHKSKSGRYLISARARCDIPPKCTTVARADCSRAECFCERKLHLVGFLSVGDKPKRFEMADTMRVPTIAGFLYISESTGSRSAPHSGTVSSSSIVSHAPLNREMSACAPRLISRRLGAVKPARMHYLAQLFKVGAARAIERGESGESVFVTISRGHQCIAPKGGWRKQFVIASAFNERSRIAILRIQ